MKAEFCFDLENAAWPAFVVDGQGRIRRASRASAAVLGAIMEESQPHLSAIWSLENEHSAAQFLNTLEHLATPFHQLFFRVIGGGSASFSTNICSFVRDDRKFYVFQLLANLSSSPVPAGEGLAVSKAQLAEAAAQRQKLDCALQLTRTVALDFNNALTSILVYTSHILSKIEPHNPWRNALVEVEKSAEKAAEIAADLAAFSRQEKDPRTQRAGNLNEVLRRTVGLFQKAGETAPLWHLQLENRLYTVSFDEAKMQQAFVKILENAIQALPEGKGGSIGVSSRNLDLAGPTKDRTVQLAPGCYVCVEVVDDGCGMAPDVLARVFEPFFTTKYRHRGLGLAWVYGIITNHGGSVVVSSEPERGTSVRVYLPAQKKVVWDTAVQAGDLLGHETILLVDDEDLLLTMGQTVLSAFGYRVLTANSGAQALALLAKEDTAVDLVITDLVMPHMSGRELIEHLRRLRPNLRIICSSGYVRPTTEEEEAYLQKPFTSQDLLLRVKQALAPR